MSVLCAAAGAATLTTATNAASPFTVCPLLSLIHAHQIIHLLALLQDLDAERVFHLSKIAIDLDQVRLPLRVDVTQQFRDAQREFALLSLLALLEQRTHAAECIGIGG